MKKRKKPNFKIPSPFRFLCNRAGVSPEIMAEMVLLKWASDPPKSITFPFSTSGHELELLVEMRWN